MAGNVNKVFLMGNLTRDIEIRSLQSGMSVGNFGLAVNERYKDRDGNWSERANFVDCEAWGKQAEIMGQYLGKGRPVFIEGKLRLDQWQDQQGQNRSKLKVVVDNFQFVDSRGDAQGGGAPRGGSGNAGGYGGGGAGGGGGGYQDAPPPVADDDIPF